MYNHQEQNLSSSSTTTTSTVLETSHYNNDDIINYPSFVLKADSLRVVFSLVSSIYELRKDQYAVMAVNAKGN